MSSQTNTGNASTSPSRTRRPSKRIKLESTSPSPPHGTTHKQTIKGKEINEQKAVKNEIASEAMEEDDDQHNCSICLQGLVDRTVIPTCSHEFCFECILVWSEQSRRCPLCSQAVPSYLIHHIRSKYDYQKYYLTPLRSSPGPLPLRPSSSRRQGGQRRERHWSRRELDEREEADELERAIAKRRWVYDHGLYAKHVASNAYTRYRPYPTPAQFTSSSDLVSRTTTFLRRELRVWVGLDVEFLTTFTVSLMKSIDIRSESAVKLMAEFLDMDSGGDRKNAEHFAHEVYCYLRSPYRDLAGYDAVVQYDVPENLPPPNELEQTRRWRHVPRSPRERHRSRSHVSRSRSRSTSSTRRGIHRGSERRIDNLGSPRRRLSGNESQERSRSRRRSRSHDRERDREDWSRDVRDASMEPRHKRAKPSHNQSRRPKEENRYHSNIRSTRSPSPFFGPQRPDEAVVKGKQRATQNQEKEIIDVDKEDEDERPSIVPVIEPPTRLRNSRQPRNRSLLESVQAHLGSSSERTGSSRRVVLMDQDPSVTSRDSFNSTQVQDDASKPEMSSKPSPLTRLDGHDTMALPASPTAVGMQGLEITEPSSMTSRKALSPPEIMARTRARLAQLKDEHVAGVSPVSPVTEVAISLLNTPQDDISSSSLRGDARAQLLNRLEDAKTQILTGEESSPGTAPSTTHSGTNSTPNVDADLQAAEAKLRKMAQVRIRLAAAKRAAGEQPGPSKFVASNKEGREESLRARLRERRA